MDIDEILDRVNALQGLCINSHKELDVAWAARKAAEDYWLAVFNACERNIAALAEAELELEAAARSEIMGRS